MPTRQSWLDEKSQAPQIDRYVEKLESVVEAMADGRVDDKELQAQQQRVISLMKEIEPQLNDELHAKVTDLLCALTALEMMETMHTMQQARPKTVFHG
jgi:hypothetical protein